MDDDKIYKNPGFLVAHQLRSLPSISGRSTYIIVLDVFEFGTMRLRSEGESSKLCSKCNKLLFELWSLEMFAAARKAWVAQEIQRSWRLTAVADSAACCQTAGTGLE